MTRARTLASLLLFPVLLVAPPTLAQSEPDSGATVFASDRYAAGEDLSFDEVTPGDLFAAGDELMIDAPVEGAVHLAGRRVEIDAPIGGALYAFAYAVDLRADVRGAATLFASEIEVDSAFGGNLRLFASDARLSGTVAGSAIVMASDLQFDAAVAGDMMLGASDIDWGDGASVSGDLIVYTEDGAAIDIPETVAPAARVTFREAEEFDSDIPEMADLRETAVRGAIWGFVMSVLFVAALATGIIALVPERVAQWRATALAHPGRSLGAGFVGLSTIVGAGFVASLTVIGIILLPAAILLGGLAGYAGYVMGSYILGVGVWRASGRVVPDGVLQKGGLAVLGAVIAGLIALVPFLGWLFVLALALLGLGAIVQVARGHGEPPPA